MTDTIEYLRTNLYHKLLITVLARQGLKAVKN